MKALKLRDPDERNDPEKVLITVCSEFAQLITNIPFTSSKFNIEFDYLNHFYREERLGPESF